MSLIPLDEPRGDGPDGPRAASPDTTLTGRLLATVKALLLALPGVSALANRSAEEPESVPSAEPVEQERATDRKTPATLPSAANVGTQVDVVSTESEETLTVEAVDNPDATITSDTWEPVER